MNRALLKLTNTGELKRVRDRMKHITGTDPIQSWYRYKIAFWALRALAALVIIAAFIGWAAMSIHFLPEKVSAWVGVYGGLLVALVTIYLMGDFFKIRDAQWFALGEEFINDVTRLAYIVFPHVPLATAIKSLATVGWAYWQEKLSGKILEFAVEVVKDEPTVGQPGCRSRESQDSLKRSIKEWHELGRHFGILEEQTVQPFYSKAGAQLAEETKAA